MATKYQSKYTGAQIDEAIEHSLLLKDNSVTDKEKAALKLLAANAFVIDDETGKTYKIGAENGKFYFTESEVSVMEIVDAIVDATSTLFEPDSEE